MALVTASGELLARLLANVVAHRPFSYGPQMVWMTPLADLVVFGLLALLIGAVSAAFPGARRPLVRLACLTFLGWLTGLLLVPRLHLWARVALAAGLAVRTAAAFERRTEWLQRVVARTLPAMLACAVVAGVAAEAVPVLRERRMEAGLPPPSPGAPNVLLIIWDTVRANALSLYGYSRPTTPYLSQFAERGVTFERAIAPAPYTLASHASFFTGRWAHELSTDWGVPLDDGPPTLAEALAGAGYRTGAFSANTIFVTREFGLGRGFAHFREHGRGLREVMRHSTLARTLVTSESFRRLTGFDDDLVRVSAPSISSALVTWLEPDRIRPWFAFANMMEAHAPYLPVPPFDTMFGWYRADTPVRERRRVRALARPRLLMTPEQARALRPAYDGAIAELDAATNALLEQLERRGLLANTLVIIASDHGEEFGEHGVFGHGNSLYFQSLHVPLVVVLPGLVPHNRRIRRTVSLRDLPATVLDLVGRPGGLPGRSLRPLWSPDSTAFPGSPAIAEVRHARGLPASYPVSGGDLASVVTDSLQLIRDGRGREEIYDLIADPAGSLRARITPSALASVRVFLPQPHRR